MEPETGALPFIEDLGPCEGHGEATMLLIHGTDGSHAGFAVNLVRARHDQDDDFAAMILDAASADEMLRSVLDLVICTTFGLVAAVDGVYDCADGCPDCAECDGCSGDCEDGPDYSPAAAYGYLTSVADNHLAAGGSPELALLAQDIADSVLADGETVVMHATDVEHVFTLAAHLMRLAEIRYGLTFEDQVEGIQEMIARA